MMSSFNSMRLRIAQEDAICIAKRYSENYSDQAAEINKTVERDVNQVMKALGK